MMINSRRSKKSGRPYFYLILALALVVFGGGLLSRNLGGLALSLGRPFWQARAGTASAWQTLISLFADKQRLLTENDRLKLELTLSSARAADRDRLAADNETLRADLGHSDSNPGGRILARPLVGRSTDPFDILALDLGAANQPPLQVGDRVLAADNIWLGAIIEVFNLTSKSRLLSAAGQTTAAVFGQERTPILLTGRGGGNFVATLPRGVNIKPGETVSATTISGDLIVALVGAVDSTSSQLDEKIYLRQPVRASSLNYVIINTH